MPHPAEDPLLHSARREAVVTLVVFAAAMVYTVVYCTQYGFNRSLESLTFVFGVPDWIFWGVLAPWGVSLLAAFWLSFFYMRDEPLDDAAAPSDVPAAEESSDA